MPGALPIGVQPLEAIEAAREEASARLSDAREPEMYRGALAAYDWLTGQTPAPLSESAEPTLRNIIHEEDLAEATINGAPDAPKVPRYWAIGYQHALMWARGAAAEPPH